MKKDVWEARMRGEAAVWFWFGLMMMTIGRFQVALAIG